ncbi:MAG: outer-membrane lipoprotein carrier protein LolA [Pirellulales bacterium]|nr:outer-membrane lipoprotein carrier protein LolA [Pirellulales bacterium]
MRTFECDFNRFTYDATFGNPNKPMFVDSGQLKYSAPDKGMFKVEGPRPEHWICDGKSIFEYKFGTKQLIEHKLPPELQGKAISDGPIPFLFGANAEKLKQRYYLRITTDPARAKEEVWLEAFPRFQQDAANFERADLILKIENMQPFAVRVYEPGGRQHKVYEFKNILVNQNNLFSFLKGDPFTAKLPGLDWKRIVEEAPAPAEARRR